MENYNQFDKRVFQKTKKHIKDIPWTTEEVTATEIVARRGSDVVLMREGVYLRAKIPINDTRPRHLEVLAETASIRRSSFFRRDPIPK